MKKNALFLVLWIFTLPNLSAQKDETNVELNQIQVNADRTKLYSSMGRVVQVIEKAEIERAPVKSIDDLLDYIAGIDVRQRGMNGVQSDVSIRGGSFDQILVLLNGVNITDPQTGHYTLDIPLELADVSRVEILQGSAARVLGPNAFSGAINIITGEETRNRLSSRTSTGSYGYLAENLSGNYKSELFQTFASAAHKKSDGYIPNTDFNITSAFIQSKLNTRNAGLFEWQLATQFKAYGANSFYTVAYPNQFENTKTFFSSLNWVLKNANFTFSAQAYWRRHHDRFELFRNFEGADAYPWYKGHNYHMTDVTGGKFTVAYESNFGKTTLGIDVRNEHIFSNVLGTALKNPKPVPFEKNVSFTKDGNRFLPNVFLDQSVNFNKWYVSAGAALLHSKQFGTNINGGAEIAYKPSDDARIYAAANSAVRLPTFTDLYYQSATQISNPNLLPEKSWTFEFGTKVNPHNWTFSAVTYYRLGKNIIDWVKKTDEAKWQSKNLTEVNAFGADFNVEYRFTGSFVKSANIAYSFLNLDKNASGYDSKYALDYLKHKIVAGINHKIWSKLSANWNLAYYDRNGGYTDFTTKKIEEYAPYIMFNSKLMWSARKVLFFADVNNIFNQKYVDFGGIAQPGTNFTVGVQLNVL